MDSLHTLLILSNVIYLNCQANTTLHDPVAPIARLVALTIEQCGRIEWCHINITDPTYFTNDGAGCCKQCTCSDECLVARSCCPDFNLRETLKGHLFSNVSDMMATLRRSKGPVDHVRHAHTSQPNDTRTPTCSHSGLKPLSPNRPKSSMYFMVSSCSNESIELDLKSKCESTYNLNANIHPTDYMYLPVQSLTTGVVYRNEHCFACSTEEHGEYVYWDILVVSNRIPQNILNDVISSFKSILKAVLSDERKDMFFEPPNAHFTELPLPVPCEVVDVKTCLSGDEVYEDLETDAACRSYSLPVYALDNGTVKSFQNIACTSCNNALRGCSVFYRWGQSSSSFFSPQPPFLGTLDPPDDAYRSINTEVDDNTVDNAVAKLFSSNCAMGYVYDKELDMCRKIYCPCGMMIRNSTCVFLFDKINAEFGAIVTVHVTRKLQNTSDVNIWSYLQRRINASEIFTPRTVSLFKVKRSDGEYAAVITVAQRNSSIKYSDVMSEALKLFKGSFSFKTNTNEGIKITTTVTDTMIIGRLTVVDRSSGKTYHPVVPSNDEHYVPGRTVTISECNFCYRVEVMQSEFQYLPTREFYIKRTKTILHHSFLHHFYQNYTTYILCVDRVFNAPVNLYRNDIEEASVPSPDIDLEIAQKTVPTLREVEYLIAFPATVTAVILVVCVTRRVCKRTIEANVPNEIQLSTLSQP